jgi:hypothetical protein
MVRELYIQIQQPTPGSYTTAAALAQPQVVAAGVLPAGVLPHPSEDRDVNVMPRVWAAVALVVLLLALCEAKKCVARLVNA